MHATAPADECRSSRAAASRVGVLRWLAATALALAVAWPLQVAASGLPQLERCEPQASGELFCLGRYRTAPAGAGERAFALAVPRGWAASGPVRWPMVLWLHGGGYHRASSADFAETERPMLLALARRGVIAVAPTYATVDYPLLPATDEAFRRDFLGFLAAAGPRAAAVDAHAQAEDPAQLLRGLMQPELLQALRVSPTQVSVAGTSAGGELAFRVAALSGLALRCIATSGAALDLEELASPGLQGQGWQAGAYVVQRVFGNDPALLRAISPLHRVHELQAQTVYLQHVEQDTMVPATQPQRFQAAFRNAHPGRDLRLRSLSDPLLVRRVYGSLDALRAAPPQHCRDDQVCAALQALLVDFLAGECGALVAASGSARPGAPAALALDGDPATAHASPAATRGNAEGLYLAAWFSGRAPPVAINRVALRAAGAGAPHRGFPRRYDLFLTTPDNGRWTFVGRHEVQPGEDGWVELPVPGASTYGVLVVPVELGVDEGGRHVLQVAELRAYWR
jgi:dienelactone hydrolase